MHPLAETLLDEPVIAAVKTDDALTAAWPRPAARSFCWRAPAQCGGAGPAHPAPESWPSCTSTLWTPFGAGSCREFPHCAVPPGWYHFHPPVPDPAGAPSGPADHPAGVHPGLPFPEQPFRPAGTRQAGLCGDPARHHAPGHHRDQYPHPGAGDRGRLLRDKADVMAAMRAGASAVSTSAPELWDI